MNAASDSELVVAASWYANTAPLAHYLAAVNPRVRVVAEHPARVAALLRSGTADVGLVPVIDVFDGTLTRIPGIGVCAEDEVESVLIKCYRPLPAIRFVETDPASHTSNALAAILLRQRFGIEPEMGAAVLGREPDAAVVIGDRALCLPPAPHGDYDMAREWKAMTGLPFVFAVWAHRPAHPRAAELEAVVRRAKEAGTAALDDLARLVAGRLGLPLERARRYLGEAIHYDVGPREEEAIARFRALANVGRPTPAGGGRREA